jgi:DNA-binding transcriptional ArsR family regulator
MSRPEQHVDSARDGTTVSSNSGSRGGVSRIQVDVSPAYDFLKSLAALAHPSGYPRWRPWAEEAANALRDRERQRLRRWFGARLALGDAYAALIPTLPEPHGVPEFLRAVAEMPLADFLRVAVTVGFTDPDTPLDAEHLLSLRDDAAARAYLDRHLRLTGQSRTRVMHILADPEAARADLLAVLRSLERGFAELEPQLRDERERGADALRAMLAQRPSTPPEWLTGHEQLAGFSPAVAAVSTLMDMRVDTYYHEIRRPLFDGTAYEPLLIRVGAQRALGAKTQGRGAVASPRALSNPAERAAQNFALLADPSRLRLVRLLAERPCYGQELAAALAMSGATVCHHVAQLAKVGLVGVERRAHRTYFVLDVNRLVALLREGQGYLLGERLEVAGQGA